MSSVFIDALFGILAACAGGVGGWYLRRNSRAGAEPKEVQNARQVLARLHELAANVAADVGQHTSRVEEINEELTADGPDNPEVVLSAVDKLIQANTNMQLQLATADERLREQAQQIQSHAAEARTDALTQLPNRRAFDDETRARAAEFKRHGRVLSVAMIDVDHFKKFNDTYGHQAGDEVLRGLGRVLRETAREMDIPARYGGEEFSLILPGTPIADAARAADRVREKIAEARFHFEGNEVQVTASLGVAQLLRGETVEETVKRADEALYASKQAGRNRTYYHHAGESHPVAQSRETESSRHEQTDAPVAAEARGDSQPAMEGVSKPAAIPATEPAISLPADEKEKVCNRDAFTSLLGRRMAEWRRGGSRPAVILVRIDEFEPTVEEHGTGAAKVLLRATSQFLRAAIRDMDLLAHFDTSTFAVMLPGAGLDDTMRIAERLREAIARCTLPLPSGRIQFTVSLGGSEAVGEEDALTMIARTNEALKAACKSGGNCCYGHNGEWSEIAEAITTATSA